ncbi:unnamed protein product [Leptidea sinapis]|uniref:Paramyosin n=1 Tax=Leptidea sinapis TaxID=189913 RepID=A0A5E4PN82_9NEOP|nr:unnamed protein product [Leptidea sinapis]
MALGWRICGFATFLLLLSCSSTESRNVTTQDIRDAILSLVNMFRQTDDKLERHEQRERGLGEILKKYLASIDKKQKALEPLKGIVSRIDERLSNVENVFLQKEEKEKVTEMKTNEVLQDIYKSLKYLTDTVNRNLNNAPAVVERNLTTEEDRIGKRLDATDAKLNDLKQEIVNLRNSFNKDTLQAVCLDMVTDMNPFERHISETEKLLNKYQLKLNEFNESATKVQTDFVPLSEVSLADEAWHNKMTEVMERQEKEIQNIQKLLSDAEGMWKDLPRLADLKRETNYTLEAIANVRNNSTSNQEKTVSRMSTKLHELSDSLLTTYQEIQQHLTQGKAMSERAYNDIQRSYDNLRNEVQTLSKNEHVMLQTSDEVVALKKRIEYGINRILIEVGEVIRTQGRTLNTTMLDRLNTVEGAILDNHSLALTNLSRSMEAEMSKVWRQIGIMHQQLSASKNALDKLNGQTEQYVNGSVLKMDGINEKVGLITTRMNEVDENLNYLLGRLSLVTQEFGMIKTGLGEALNKINAGLQEVQIKKQPTESSDGNETNNTINEIEESPKPKVLSVE